jgi:aminoglycoside phosphotransferase (APT) family kinase protein
MEQTAGIDVPKVAAWLDGNISGASAPYSFELIAGGNSNLTFRVIDSVGHQYALRRPPLNHVLPTAHDMAREHRIISALSPTPVPVPAALGLCTDPDVNGAPFYVMNFVDGVVLRDTAIIERLYNDATRRSAGEKLVDVLADLHAVDVDAIGLGDLARKDGYISRQLKRWYSQFQQSAAMGERTVPAIDEMHAFLSSRIPEQGPSALVHGDYRLDNAVFDKAGTVLAVLDWEICTLGDPLADLGWLMVYWTEPGEKSPLETTPTAVPGFPTKGELQDRYTAKSGRDLSLLDFYISFGYWKLACILEGVFARYSHGSSGGDTTAWESFAAQVELLGDWAKMAAEKL